MTQLNPSVLGEDVDEDQVVQDFLVALSYGEEPATSKGLLKAIQEGRIYGGGYRHDGRFDMTAENWVGCFFGQMAALNDQAPLDFVYQTTGYTFRTADSVRVRLPNAFESTIGHVAPGDTPDTSPVLAFYEQLLQDHIADLEPGEPVKQPWYVGWATQLFGGINGK